ncbi:amino acid adenylation domain-containing protein [Streptomyces sp. NPDC015242]|uniref:amino acid adenylation domain-containing protein n=1 Tax=Streptomyces sp. NPDC015242 TaxID=3364951 RepID=UPI0036FEC80B
MTSRPRTTPSLPAPDAGEPVLLVTDHPRALDSGTAPLRTLTVDLPPLPRHGTGGDEESALLLAAYAVLLHRYTGRRRLLVDSDRGALTLTVDPAGPVAALLAGCAAPRPAGPPAGAPVRYADHTAPGTPTGAGAATAPGEACELLLTHEGDRARLAYRSSLFEPATMERFAEHLLRVREFLARRPDATVGEADLLSEDELALIFGTLNDTAVDWPDTATVHGLFAEQARRAPEATAVTWADGRMDYRELDRRSAELAAELRTRGVRTGDRVGLRAAHGPELVVAALGILRAGAAYVALEPDHPAERTGWLLADSSVRVLVSGPGLPAAPPFDGTVLTVDVRDHEHAAAPLPAATPGLQDTGAGSPDGPASAGDLAYICYTSGTTGTPKGVQVTHRNVVRLVKGTAYVPFGPDTRMLPTGSVAFDASTFEIWGPLLNGGSLHMADRDVILNARELGRELSTRRITTMWLTSPLFNQLVEQDAKAFRSLRELVVGGDALSSPHVAKALDACPELTVVNGYGPTENTTFSLTHRVTRDDLDGRRIPIGRPIANSTAYVLDEAGRLCPVGVPGELCLGGAGVTLGYLGRPDLTAERFTEDPFVPGGRMYRSGDLARLRPDGVIDFLGRRDHQVKIRGFRIEPAEVEKAMLGHPRVAEAVVTARPLPGRGDLRLCGYYAGPRPPGPEELRDHLARTLPGHMVPTHLVPLERLPLTHTGKLDRGRLPDPDGSPLLAATPYTAPADEIERTLVELAEAALGLTGIGTGHDLRDLGADSLTATLIAAGAQERLGRHCPAGAVLRSGTPARLAALLRDSTATAAARIPAAPDAGTYPVTPQQRQVYLEQIKDERAVHYNVPVTLDLPAGTDPARLADALRRLPEYHEALRTRFTVEGGEVRQCVEARTEPSVRVVDDPRDATPPGAFVRPFDLARAPLWRAEVHRAGEGVRLRLDLHHIIVDGFSLTPLLEDLALLYEGGEPTPPARRYRDYAVWLRGRDATAAREAQAPHWEEVFAEPVDPADLPTDRPRPPLRALDGDVLVFGLGRERTERIRAVARAHDVTPFAVLASAYALLLAGLKGTADITIGTPVSGRTVPGLHRTVGMFANTVVLRLDADPALPYDTFLRRTGEAAEQASAHQDFPFEEVVARTAPGRDYSRTPLFDALLALHSARYLSVEFRGTRVPLRLEQTGQAVFDLNMQVHETPGGLSVAWQYAAGLLHRDTVEGWRDTFTSLLDTATTDPATSLGALLPAPSGFDLDFDL